jgi:tripartite-type tricarboxylate transporter receptor subunit TctC
MRRAPSTLIGIAMAVSTAILGSLPAAAQEPASAYPSRNILAIVPYPPGGPPDVIMRLVAPLMADALGKPVVVENRPGASTTIGATAVARAAPDGYTLLASDIAQTVVPNTVANLAFDPAKDLKPVVLMAKSVFTMVIDPKLPIKTTADLVAYSKANPDAIKAGHSGVGTPPHLYLLSLANSTGMQMLMVPYRGIALAVADVVAGHIQLIGSAPSTTVNLTLDGKVRMLGVSGDRRLAQLPDVPTFKEQGITLKGFEQDTWFGISVPGGTPDAIVTRLNGVVNTAIKDKKVIETLAKVDIRTAGGTPAEFGQLWNDQIKVWREVLIAAGVKPAEAK